LVIFFYHIFFVWLKLKKFSVNFLLFDFTVKQLLTFSV
jgi:hypothetical protein